MGKIADEITDAVSDFVTTIFSLKKEYARKFVCENLSKFGDEVENEILKLVKECVIIPIDKLGLRYGDIANGAFIYREKILKNLDNLIIDPREIKNERR